MDIRIRPEPPDAIKGVTPVKDQGVERDKWKRGQRNAGEKDEEDKATGDNSGGLNSDEKEGKSKPKAKDNTGRIVDVVI